VNFWNSPDNFPRIEFRGRVSESPESDQRGLYPLGQSLVHERNSEVEGVGFALDEVVEAFVPGRRVSTID
jgi:hypothetical protein